MSTGSQRTLNDRGSNVVAGATDAERRPRRRSTLSHHPFHEDYTGGSGEAPPTETLMLLAACCILAIAIVYFTIDISHHLWYGRA